ncbi:DUF2188 domain-containing protein [Stutzerimonas tarimensis]|uniref:DUF2188 domain-containing protein n=1 Tax=Stutzerimonas tarimensis TaxID=1507735 RepID=A0ABV7TA38_9GAMM
MEIKTYHITHEDERWMLKEDGFADALVEASDQDDILEKTRDYLKLRKARVLVHDAQGQVERELVYPRDQHPQETGG